VATEPMTFKMNLIENDDMRNEWFKNIRDILNIEKISFATDSLGLIVSFDFP
jgi:hypothetical protein